MTPPASDPTRVCVIFNPTARGEAAQRLQSRIQSLAQKCALKPTPAAGAARTLATEAVREGFGTIVAMGGDGTVNEVLNGMADAPDGLARSRLAVLPVGTVNVFARELGSPLQFQRAWEMICRGRERLVDLPEMAFETESGPQRRCFAQMAGCGLDARAIQLMNWGLKKKIGQFAYLVSGFKALRETPPSLVVTTGASRYAAQLVLLGNGRFYGGSVPLFERADLADGLLDICIFPKINWLVILRYGCAFVSPKLICRGIETHFQASSVRIESVAPTPAEVDGEWVGNSPVQFTIRRQALRVVAP